MIVTIDEHEVFFDDDDVMLLFNFKWRIFKRGHTYYAESGSRIVGGFRTNGMHHLIFPRKNGFVIDHINGNGLDNRRSNLRYATLSENQWNQRIRPEKKFKGTYFYPNGKKPWTARIQANNRSISLGRFVTERDAAIAYNKAAEKLHGRFAKLNKIDEVTL